jgi:uncharacterized protein (DUF433 family)
MRRCLRHACLHPNVLHWGMEALDARINTRIPRRVRESLTALARRRGLQESELTRSLLDEGLRREQHAGIVFRTTPTGREAAIEGRRLYVWQVVETVRANEGDVGQAADFLQLRPDQIRIAIDYYGEYTEEIDELMRLNLEESEQGRTRWEQGQRALKP